MIRDIIFVILIYLVFGVAFAFTIVRKIQTNKWCEDRVQSLARSANFGYELTMYVLAVISICFWPYFMIRAVIDSVRTL